MTKGVVYVLSNPAMDGYIKIGKTTNLEQRLKSLDNTSTPLPFRCIFAIEVEDMDQVERLARQTFKRDRVRSNRRFFDTGEGTAHRHGRELALDKPISQSTCLNTGIFIKWFVAKHIDDQLDVAMGRLMEVFRFVFATQL